MLFFDYFIIINHFALVSSIFCCIIVTRQKGSGVERSDASGSVREAVFSLYIEFFSSLVKKTFSSQQ